MRLTILLLFLTLTIFAQNDPFSKKDFGLPVEIPIYLSGTFGELRGNHFHTGIDIKTQGTTGKKILAIEDGWVSRIKISTSGYGKAIYITHPDGYISVYGHLDRFNDTIQKVVVEEQYLKESFEIQMFFDENEIRVSKGEIIAYSGNTGGSMGPHLHFEIRDLSSQNPLNPLLFQTIKVKDYYRPKIKMLGVYPVNNSSLINGKNDTLFVDIAGWGIDHRLVNMDTITIAGPVSFGISTHDLMNDVPNKNGVYSTRFYHDTTLVYDIEMKRLSFKTGRYINSLIDYPYYKKSKTRLVRTQVDTNNRLGSYKFVSNNGIIDFNDTLCHHMKFEIRDVYENLATLKFIVLGDSYDRSLVNSVKSPKRENKTNHFLYHKKNIISDSTIYVSFPSNTFYQSFNFDFQIQEQDSNALSPTYKLHNKFIPAHKYFTIQIDCDTTTDTLYKYSYIAYSENNADYYFSGRKIIKGKQIVKSRTLGYYRIMADTISPEIIPVNIREGKKLNSQKSINVKIKDNETGIASYRATLNNKWILMEYEPKKDLLIYYFDDLLIKGENSFRIEVKDLIGNSTAYECSLVY